MCAAALKMVINRNIKVAQNTRKSDVERKLAENKILMALKRLDKVHSAKANCFMHSREVNIKK